MTMPHDDESRDIRSRATVQSGGGSTNYGAAMGKIAAAGGKAIGAMPTYQATSAIIVTGTPEAAMSDLAQVAWACLQFRLTCLPAMLNKMRDKKSVLAPATVMHWAGDWAKRQVTLIYQQECGPLATAFAGKFAASQFFQPMSFAFQPEGGAKIDIASDTTHSHRKTAPGRALRGEGNVPVMKVAKPGVPATNPDAAKTQHQMTANPQDFDPSAGAAFKGKDVGLIP